MVVLIGLHPPQYCGTINVSPSKLNVVSTSTVPSHIMAAGLMEKKTYVI